MNLVDFLLWIERESRCGTGLTGAAAAGDQTTLDILTSTNARRKRIWRKTDWSWCFEQVSFAVAPGTVIYTVASASGRALDRIWNLIPNDPTATPPVSGKALNQRTERAFFDKLARYGPAFSGPGLPTDYMNLGKTPAGAWQVRLFPSPASTFTMGGSAKGVLNTFLIGDVTGIAPFSAGNLGQAANPSFDYFPDGVVEDVLFEGVMSDMASIQGQVQEALARNASFEAKIKVMAGEEANATKDDTPITSPLPAGVRRRR